MRDHSHAMSREDRSRMPEEFTAVADCHRKPGIRLLVQSEDDRRKVSEAGGCMLG